MKTNKTFEIEIMRHNVTPAQFLAYVRSRVDQKGGRYVRTDLDLNYFKRGDDLNFDVEHDPEEFYGCIAEKSVSKPYEMQTYVRYENGAVYNEICEFQFDDDKTGFGYYYLINVDAVEEEEKNVEQIVEEIAQEDAQDAQKEKGESEMNENKNTLKKIDLEEKKVETAQEKADRENWEYCKQIAKEIETIVDGGCYRCPECGEIIKRNNDCYNGEEASYTCSECGKTFDECDLEPFGIYDYFQDVYDIEYRIGSDRGFRSVRLMVACGGPNVYIDTASRAVELYWWSDHASYSLNDEAVEAINAEFEELFACC